MLLVVFIIVLYTIKIPAILEEKKFLTLFFLSIEHIFVDIYFFTSMEYKTNKSDIGESNGRFVMTLLSFNLNLRSVLSSDLGDIIERCSN